MTKEEFVDQLEKERDMAHSRSMELRAERDKIIEEIRYWDSQSASLSTAKARFDRYTASSLAI